MLRLLPQPQQHPSPSPLPTNKRPSSRGGGGGGWAGRKGQHRNHPSFRAAARWLVAAWVVAATAARAASRFHHRQAPPLLAIIGVLSPPGHFAQRALIRQTYARDPPEGIAVRFVVADVDEGRAEGARPDNANNANNNAAISRDATLGPDDLWRQADGNLARALAHEARVFGDLAWRLPTLRGVHDDRAHMARKTLGWFQAVGSGAWAAAADGGGGEGAPSSAASSSSPLFVLKTDDDVVLHLPNLKRRLLRILEEGRLLGEEEEEGQEEEKAASGGGSRKGRRRQDQQKQQQLGANDPWIYFGRPISSPIFPEGNMYMQGSLYGFSRALARAVAEATPTVAQVEKGGDGGGAASKEDDPAPLDGHEDYLASQWVLRAVAHAGHRLPHTATPPPPPPVVLWANASRAEVHDTPLIASQFSLRLIAPRRVLAVHNAKHPLEFMHAYGGTVAEELEGGGGL